MPGDVTDPAHRAELVAAAGDRIDLVVNNAGGLGPSPLPGLADYPLDELADLFAVNVVAPLGLIQAALPKLAPDAVIVDITSDASVEAYEGWGGYGATKAALDHARPGARRRAARPAGAHHRPGRHAHADAPGRLPRRGHLRPPAARGERAGHPALIEGDRPSGRYRASEVVP